MKAGIATIALRKYDIFKAIDLAAEAGFQGVEVWGRPPHTPEPFDPEHTEKIRERMEANGLQASMFGSYVNPCSKDFELKAAESIEIASILGASIVRVWAGNKEPQDADDDLWNSVARSLREYAIRANERGLTLAMEMHGGTLALTAEGCLRLLEIANVPNLKVNFQVDTAKNPDIEGIVAKIGDYVVNIHAQNHVPSETEPGKMELAWVESGLLDYDKIVGLLSEHGFDGFIEVEFLRGEFAPDEGVMLESMRRDAAYLRSLAEKYSRK